MKVAIRHGKAPPEQGKRRTRRDLRVAQTTRAARLSSNPQCGAESRLQEVGYRVPHPEGCRTAGQIARPQGDEAEVLAQPAQVGVRARSRAAPTPAQLDSREAQAWVGESERGSAYLAALELSGRRHTDPSVPTGRRFLVGVLLPSRGVVRLGQPLSSSPPGRPARARRLPHLVQSATPAARRLQGLAGDPSTRAAGRSWHRESQRHGTSFGRSGRRYPSRGRARSPLPRPARRRR
jgi:hypothetical protein